MAIKVLIAEDHPTVRDSLCRLLKRLPDMDPVVTVQHPRIVMHTLSRDNVDVVILNVDGDMVGSFASIRHLLKRRPGVKLIVMSIQTDRHYVQEAFGAGCSGYLVKDCVYEELPKAVRCVLDGSLFVSREIFGVPECRHTMVA